MFRSLKYVVKIAKPMADSVAATVKINTTKIWPMISSKYIENIVKLILTVKRINSSEIMVIKIFFRFNIIPKTLIKNKIDVTRRKFNIFRISIFKSWVH